VGESEGGRRRNAQATLWFHWWWLQSLAAE